MHDGTAFVFNADVETDGGSQMARHNRASRAGPRGGFVLLAVLTLGMVRSTEPVEATPPTPIIHSVTTVPADRGAGRSRQRPPAEQRDDHHFADLPAARNGDGRA